MAHQFVTHDERFHGILGPQPTLELLVENKRYPFAHEAGVYFPDTNELFITSNRFCDPGSEKPRVQISKVVLGELRTADSTTCEEIDSSAVPMGNGGVNYGHESMLFCAQGSQDMPSGLYLMSAKSPYTVSLFLSEFHGRSFSSVNDVVVHSDGSIWFTDPPYGHAQGYRPQPQLPAQAYRYEPGTKSLRAMADGFGRPNGICFSPDEKTVYVTDTERLHGGGTIDDSKASTM
jgi:gluconolactonase